MAPVSPSLSARPVPFSPRERTTVWPRSVVCALVYCAFGVAPAAAQGIGVTPYVGGYVPLAEVIDDAGGTAEHEVGVVFGARVGRWWPGGLGVEGGLAYALSDVSAAVPGLLAASDAASVFLVSVKALYRFGLAARAVTFHIGGGGAWVSRGGDAYEGTRGTADLGAVANVGASITLGPRLAIRLDAEDYITSARFEADLDQTESKLQNDLVLSAGVRVSVGR